MNSRNFLAALYAAVVLAACGGGADDSPTPPPSGGGTGGGTGGGSGGGSGGNGTVITGTAAAGLPLVGTVTVKDAAGATRSTQLGAGANGIYSIDVAGMTAPFVFRADGFAGGREYVVHSAATQADIGNVINITPLTDLVVSNIAGQVARNYFDAPNFSSLTAAALTEEVSKLKERLLPVLQAMGVETTIDLLRTQFTPLQSQIDRAIDVLRVDYNAGVATITNVVTQQQIQDNLATRAAQEAGAATMDNTTGLATSPSDIDQIRQLLLTFSSQFATTAPSVSALKTYVSSDFLYRDRRADDALNLLVSFKPLIGSRFTDVTIRSIDYTTNPQRPLARISFLILGANGARLSFEKHWQVVKDNGAWKLHGDQRTFDVEIFALMGSNSYLNTMQGNVQPSNCKQSGLTMLIEDPDVSNTSTVDHVIVRGPGLGEGARLNRGELGGFFVTPETTNNNYRTMASTCGGGTLTDAEIKVLPSNAEYTITAYDSGGAQVGAVLTDFVPLRPLAGDELNDAQFATMVAPTFAQFLAFNGGDLTVSLSDLDPQGLAWVYGYLGYTNGQDIRVETEDQAPSNGSYTATINLPAPPPGAAIAVRELRAERIASDGREYITFWRIEGQ